MQRASLAALGGWNNQEKKQMKKEKGEKSMKARVSNIAQRREIRVPILGHVSNLGYSYSPDL